MLEGTTAEMTDVFRHMSPLLGKAPQKILPPQNGDEPGSKKMKHGKGNGKSKGKGPKTNQPQADPMLQLMARLILKHDQQLRSVLVDNSFVCFLGQHPQGMLQSMIAETMQWKQDFENKKVTRSLRSQLWLHVCQTLQKRVQMIAHADPQGELIQKCQKAKSFCQIFGGPIFSHQLKAYEVSEKEPLSAQKLTTLCQALIDHAAMEPDLIQGFHTEKGPSSSNQDQSPVPWLIQFSLRYQDTWRLLLTLQHLAVWQLVHMRWKRYSQKPSQHTQLLQKRLPSTR